MTSNVTKPTITVGEHHNLPVNDGQTILDALEQHGLEVQYHCREGFCGACRCKLKKGQVEYTLDPLAFIDDDEVLTCCSTPISNITLVLE